jgi:hypothetical protein
VNTSQKVPRAAKELKKIQDEYQKLQDAFSPVFDWLQTLVRKVFYFLTGSNCCSKLQQLLPDNYEILSQFVDVLPCEEPSPVYPFAGFVINLNVATRVHRDYMDDDICVVISISDGVGGELCLMELGLVVELRCGDAIIFKSSQLTHFNMHYIGRRASLVFHSDKRAERWAKDRNGWKHNIFMKTFESADIDFGL